MSGGFRVKNELNNLKLKEYKQDDESDHGNTWPPRFTRIQFLTSNNCDVCYTDLRKFGHFYLISNTANPLSCEPLSKLGFDPLLVMPTCDEFKVKLFAYRSQTCEIKTLLLDQAFCCGIGNWVADEILYHSKIHPRKRLNTLTDTQQESVYKNIQYIIQAAVKQNGKPFPPEWLFHYRWTKKKISWTFDKQEIKFETVGGRTSAFVPTQQCLTDDEQTKVDQRLKLKEQQQKKAKKVKRELLLNNDDDEDENVVSVVDDKKKKLKRDKPKTLEMQQDGRRSIPLRQRVCKTNVQYFKN